MKFSDVVKLLSAEAAKAGLPLLFGDDSTMNVKANDITGDYLSFNISGATVLQSLSNIVVYRVTLSCAGRSFYMTDDAQELETLSRTDAVLHRVMRTVTCAFQVSGYNTQMWQNKYDSPKSGWTANFTITDDIAQ